MHCPHAVHAIHHHRRCHRTQRDDDNERDEDERNDAEDQEHDERCEQVRVTRASALTRQVACLRTPPRESQAPEQNKSLPTPDAHKTFDARYVATLGGPSP